MNVLIVTGGGRGIGAATVRLAAARGWRLCFSYVSDSDAADRLMAELRASGAEAVAVREDVADPDGVARLFDAAERLGPVAALVNNAAVTGPLGPLIGQEVATLRRVLDVNILGTMLACREALRRWARSGTKGSIVNVSSTAAGSGAPGEYVHYAASKAAVEALTAGLAKEAGPFGVRVNAVSPATTRTGIHAGAGDVGRLVRQAAKIPLGRVGEPEEVAAAILWLLSAEASFVSGSVLKVGGGL